MSFAWPTLLWLLLVPVGLLVWELLHRRRAAANIHPKILQAEAGAHSLTLVPRPVATLGEKPRFWLYLGLSLGIVALARPQWGRIEEQVFDQSREILIAVDLSRSMLAPDVKPSRLDRAKLLIESLLNRLEGERVGLVVFSGTAFLQSPLSADYEILREFLPALGPDYLPEGGTNYRALIDTAIQAFGAAGAADRFLIVLSDGEATDEDWKAGVEELKKKGIRVIGLGIGTSGGAMLPDGSGGFVKDERGAVVLSKLENSTLMELGRATNGVYRDASAWIDLPALLQATVEAGRKGAFAEKNQVRLVERFRWALAPAFLCLLLSFWREFPVRPKPRELKLNDDNKSRKSEGGMKKPEVRAAGLVTLLALLPSSFFLQPSAAAEGGGGTDALAAPLSKVVGRLATQDVHHASDWAELARTTITYGQHLQSSQQAVPEGPVRDALAAVNNGEGLDAKAADWPQLRKDLEALLKKSEQQKQEPPPQDQKQPEQNQSEQQKQEQQKQEQQQKQSQDQEKQSQSEKTSKPESPPDKSPSQSDGKPEEQKPKNQEQKKSESAFGEMKDQPPPPAPEKPPANETQKVGGAPEKKSEAAKNTDPTLVVPLQKLDQLRNQDSPARLFQLMEGDKKSESKKKGKDW